MRKRLEQLWDSEVVRFLRESVLLYFSCRAPQAAACLAYFLLLTVFPLLICVLLRGTISYPKHSGGEVPFQSADTGTRRRCRPISALHTPKTPSFRGREARFTFAENR